MPLFHPERHESLTDSRWSEPAARRAIQAIAADAFSAYTDEGLWPIHPMDRSPERAAILKPVYYGAAGVIWALDYLAAAGAIPAGRSFAPILGNLLTAHRVDSQALTGGPLHGYQTGDVGILLLHWKLAPSEEIAQELARIITANRTHPALGFVWGGAGTMLAALFMYERTGEARWRDLYLETFEYLWQCWEPDPGVGCYLWNTDLYGSRELRMSPLHGLPGIAYCLLRGLPLIDPDRGRTLIERTLAAIRTTAIRAGAHANWPLSVGEVQGTGTEMLRVQHCIGAPGVVNCLAGLPRDPETDELLLAAGELTWQAGPLIKLPSLCHGVPGNGFAFLKLYVRTGDSQWLERARRFAMHAIEQNERFTREHGQRKYSLWTGDLGLAVFLWHCIRGTAAMPVLDEF